MCWRGCLSHRLKARTLPAVSFLEQANTLCTRCGELCHKILRGLPRARFGCLSTCSRLGPDSQYLIFECSGATAVRARLLRLLRLRRRWLLLLHLQLVLQRADALLSFR